MPSGDFGDSKILFLVILLRINIFSGSFKAVIWPLQPYPISLKTGKNRQRRHPHWTKAIVFYCFFWTPERSSSQKPIVKSQKSGLIIYSWRRKSVVGSVGIVKCNNLWPHAPDFWLSTIDPIFLTPGFWLQTFDFWLTTNDTHYGRPKTFNISI